MSSTAVQSATDPVEHATLYYKGGGSDKVYIADVNPVPGGYTVTFAYGRRGATLTTGTKTPKPVDREAARKIWLKLVSEKTAKGYAPGAEIGTGYTPTELPEEFRTGGIQLLNPIDDAELEGLLRDPRMIAQPKKDGRRVQLRRLGGVTVAVNRKGVAIAAPDTVLAAVAQMGPDVELDGEMIGQTYHVFDLLSFGGTDLRGHGTLERLDALDDASALWASAGPLCRVSTARTEEEKREMLARLLAAGEEGIVFKRRDAPYVAGRPASGGDQVKYKFYATCTARAAAGRRAGKRSVELELLNEAGAWTGVGHVTVPANLDIPAPGTLVEVRYLYAYPGGSLYQPTLLGERDDLEAEAATMGQLKYKPAGEGDDEEQSEG